jgi:hypothetical protein
MYPPIFIIHYYVVRSSSYNVITMLVDILTYKTLQIILFMYRGLLYQAVAEPFATHLVSMPGCVLLMAERRS